MNCRNDPRFKNDQSAQLDYQRMLAREEDKADSRGFNRIVHDVSHTIDMETEAFGDGTHWNSVY